MPRTGPSQETVPVSPPELNVPDDGTTDNPGASEIVDVNMQCVCICVGAGDPAAPAGGTSRPPVSSTTATAAGRLPPGHFPIPAP
jgi:hypothetical protein